MTSIQRTQRRVRDHSSTRPTRVRLHLAAAAALALGGVVCPAALAATSGGGGGAKISGASVARGSASITQQGSYTVIKAGNRSVINYKQFDIPSGASVQFVQPSARSTVLNRITGGSPSLIDGKLSANGRVFFVNPSGVVFGPNAEVKAAGFVAAAANISDSDFAKNIFKFEATGSVINSGSISAGDVHLYGKEVTNGGSIKAEGGLVTLTTASGMLIGERGGTAMVKVDKSVGATGPSADSTGDLFSLAIRQGGSVKAKQVVVQSAPGAGSVEVAGKIDVSSAKKVGGDAVVLGDQIKLTGATIDASGAKGGGTIRVGGDYKGGGSLPRATQTIVDSDSKLNADATVKGNGGSVVVWSDASTTFAGKASAKGGPAGGNGGIVETSGGTLNVTGGMADASAAKGIAGTWLLDPLNLFIGDPVTLQGQFEDFNAPRFEFKRLAISADPTSEYSYVDVNTVNAALNAGTSVSLEAGWDPNNLSTQTVTINNVTYDFRVRDPGHLVVASLINKTAGGDASLTLYGQREVQFAGTSLSAAIGADGKVIQNGNDPSGAVIRNPDNSTSQWYIRTRADSGVVSTSGKLNVTLQVDDLPPIAALAQTEFFASLVRTASTGAQSLAEPVNTNPVSNPLYTYARDVLIHPRLTGNPNSTLSEAANYVRDSAETTTGQVSLIGAPIKTNGGDFTVRVVTDSLNPNGRRLRFQQNQFLSTAKLDTTGFSNGSATLPLYGVGDPALFPLTTLTLPKDTTTKIETGGGKIDINVVHAITITTDIDTGGGPLNLTTTGLYGGAFTGGGNPQVSSSAILITNPINTHGGNVNLSSSFDIQLQNVFTEGGDFIARSDSLNGSSILLRNTLVASTDPGAIPQPIGGRGQFKFTGFLNDQGTAEKATIDTGTGKVAVTAAQILLNGDIKASQISFTADAGPIDQSKGRDVDGTIHPEKAFTIGSGLLNQQSGTIEATSGPVTFTGTDILLGGSSIKGSSISFSLNEKSLAATLSPADRSKVLTLEDKDRFVNFADTFRNGVLATKGAVINYNLRVDEAPGVAGDLNSVRSLVDLELPVDHPGANDNNLRIAELYKFKSFNPSDITVYSKNLSLRSTGPVSFGGAVVGTGGSAGTGDSTSRLSIRTDNSDVGFTKSVGGPLALNIRAGSGKVSFAGGVGRVPQVEVITVDPGLGGDLKTFKLTDVRFRSLPIAISSLTVSASEVTFGGDITPTYAGSLLTGPSTNLRLSTGDILSLGPVAVSAGRINIRGDSPLIASGDTIDFSVKPSEQTTGKLPLYASPNGTGDLSNNLPLQRSQGSVLTQTGDDISIQAVFGGPGFFIGSLLTGAPFTHVVGIEPVSLTTKQITVSSEFFPRSVAEVIAGANPPIERKVQRSSPASGSDLVKLQALGVNPRSADEEILLGLFAGRNEYDDYGAAAERNDGSGIKIYSDANKAQIPIAAPRIPADSASSALSQYDLLTKDSQKRRSAVAEAWTAYKDSLGETKPTGIGFRKYLESASTPTDQQRSALDTLNRLKSVQDSLSLNPIYRLKTDKLMITPFLPSEVPPKEFLQAVNGDQTASVSSAR